MVAAALSWEQEERGLVFVGMGIEPLLKKNVGEVDGSDGRCQITSAIIPRTKSEWFRVSSTVDGGVWHHNLKFPLQARAVAQG